MTKPDAVENVVCPYCSGRAAFLSGRDIYPHRGDLCDKPFYACRPCGAWVGCHPGTKKPLGRLADQHLRKAKMRVHAALDPHWMNKGMSRSKAYARLAKDLDIPGHDCHVGMFDIAACERAVAAVQKWPE